ncbi:DgyrCDS9272 [Dimorphilus gyrociliatus]|uniref:DgyrCDS9272 n=1 Tax=Dimorphilus gyrociliatus TaxID=2664684 RepID=A0A7I8W1Q7_9ANNE|nr:DgyrCDS9272 [Dimorphilus gyrociliatus]
MAAKGGVTKDNNSGSASILGSGPGSSSGSGSGSDSNSTKSHYQEFINLTVTASSCSQEIINMTDTNDVTEGSNSESYLKHVKMISLLSDDNSSVLPSNINFPLAGSNFESYEYHSQRHESIAKEKDLKRKDPITDNTCSNNESRAASDSDGSNMFANIDNFDDFFKRSATLLSMNENSDSEVDGENLEFYPQ